MSVTSDIDLLSVKYQKKNCCGSRWNRNRISLPMGIICLAKYLIAGNVPDFAFYDDYAHCNHFKRTHSNRYREGCFKGRTNSFTPLI